MLQGIRDRATSWIVWVLIGLICAAFALTGLEGAANLLVGQDNVLEVGDQEYSKAQYDHDLKKYPDLTSLDKFRYLNDRANRDALREWLQEGDYSVPDVVWKKAILEDPNFQKDGVFNQERYEKSIQSSAKAYEAQQRSAAIAAQVDRSLFASSFVVPAQVAQFTALMKQTRTIETATVSANTYFAEQTVSDTEIADHYNDNKEQFFEPEKVQVDYIKLSLDDLKKKVTVTDELLQSNYKNQLGRFTSPNEQRLGAHILLLVDPESGSADKQAVKEKAEKLVKEARAGKAFADLAKEYSADESTKDSGGTLEWSKRSDRLSSKLDDALFALEKKGDVSEPVLTKFGYHVVYLQDVKDSDVKPFAEVKATLESEFREIRALDILADAGERLARVATQDKTLAQIAEDEELTVKTSAFFAANAVTGIGAHRAVNQEAFASLADAELTDGTLSGLVTVEDDKKQPTALFLMAKKGYKAKRQRKQEEVTNEITALIKKQKAEDKARQVASDVQKALQEGKTAADIDSTFKVKVAPAVTVGRDEGTAIPRYITQRVFAMKKPADKPTVEAFPAGQEHFVVKLIGVEAGKPEALKDAERDQIRDQLQAATKRFDQSSMVRAMRQHAGVKIHYGNAGIEAGPGIPAQP